MTQLWPGGPLYDGEGAFPVTTDSVLLADFARVRSSDAVYEPCCGAGLISVLLHARAGSARFFAVELDSAAAAAAERNFAENLLVLCCAFAACMSAWKNLTLRRSEPPTQGGRSLEAFIDQNLVAYGAARQLSKREAEVLRLVLLGKDNQNIATAMHLAPSTVKVHMHHILQKAGRSNRKELIQDFWEFS